MKSFITKDLKALKSALRRRGIWPKPFSVTNQKKFESIHKKAFLLSCWEAEVAKESKEGLYKVVFLSDLKSDVVQLLPTILMGYSKSSALLLRSMLENILKHTYYYDHPVEFYRYQNSGYRLKLEDHLEYLKNHPIIGKSVKSCEIDQQISEIYSRLSTSVHGKPVSDKDLSNSVEDIKFNNVMFSDITKTILQVSNILNFVLLLFHRSLVESLTSTDRRYYLSHLDKAAYKEFHEFYR